MWRSPTITEEPTMVRVPTDREPTHPGEMLLKEFLEPFSLTQRDLAGAIRVPYQRVNELVNGRRGVTASTALRLGRYFDTSPDYWLNLQLRWDLYRARKRESGILDQIEPIARIVAPSA
jgi:addiction module HigA family antidote